MRLLKKVVHLMHLMVLRLYHTRAISPTRPSRSPRPLRQLYHTRVQSAFSPTICGFGLVSGTIFWQLQKIHATCLCDFFCKTAITAEEQDFRNSIMRHFRKVVHLTHLMVHRFYHTCAISSTRPSRSLAICAFGLVSGTILWQMRKIHATLPTERFDTIAIKAEEPEFPIFCELRLYVRHNPTGHRSVDVYIHGFWMCIIDTNGILHHLINETPCSLDSDRAMQDLRELDAGTQFDLSFNWPSFIGCDLRFWAREFVKHAFTAIGIYRVHYFRDAVSISRQYIGGDKDIATFLENNYLPGVSYGASEFWKELSKHVGADVQIIGSNSSPWYLQEIGLLFTRDGKVLVNHPKGYLAEGGIVVRRYKGGAD